MIDIFFPHDGSLFNELSPTKPLHAFMEMDEVDD